MSGNRLRLGISTVWWNLNVLHLNATQCSGEITVISIVIATHKLSFRDGFCCGLQLVKNLSRIEVVEHFWKQCKCSISLIENGEGIRAQDKSENDLLYFSCVSFPNSQLVLLGLLSSTSFLLFVLSTLGMGIICMTLLISHYLYSLKTIASVCLGNRSGQYTSTFF